MSNASESPLVIQIAYELEDVFSFHMIVAFFTLTWLVFIGIQMIIDEVKNSPQENLKTAEQKLAIKWNRNYCLISNFTDEIDNFFKSFLLFFIGRQFFLCFDKSFQIITSAVKTKDLSDCMFQFYFIVCNLLLLLLIINGAQRMKNKVSWHFICLLLQWFIPLQKLKFRIPNS